LEVLSVVAPAVPSAWPCAVTPAAATLEAPAAIAAEARPAAAIASGVVELPCVADVVVAGVVEATTGVTAMTTATAFGFVAEVAVCDAELDAALVDVPSLVDLLDLPFPDFAEEEVVPPDCEASLFPLPFALLLALSLELLAGAALFELAGGGGWLAAGALFEGALSLALAGGGSLAGGC